MNTCSKCKAEIIWRESASVREQFNRSGGEYKPKMHPINRTPDSDGTIALITGEKTLENCYRHLTGEALRIFQSLGGILYKSHFDTCIYAGEFRRRKS